MHFTIETSVVRMPELQDGTTTVSAGQTDLITTLSTSIEQDKKFLLIPTIMAANGDVRTLSETISPVVFVADPCSIPE